MGERGQESDNTTVKRVREEEEGSEGRLRNGEGGVIIIVAQVFPK